jgi:hypothetical protein
MSMYVLSSLMLQILYFYKEFNTEYIKVTTGVRQGCILSPTFVLLMVDDVMRKATTT